MTHNIKWIADIYEVTLVEAFFLYLYFKWRRAREYSDPLRDYEVTSNTTGL